MINVYASPMSTDPDEVHRIVEETTVRAWLSQVEGFDETQSHRVSVECNGRYVHPSAWVATTIKPSDTVEVCVQPQGGFDLLLAGLTIRETVRPLLNALTPDVPGSPAPGTSLDVANLTNNVARLGGVVPQLLGSYRRYPDMLLPIHRFFAGRRRQQIELFMCVGDGRYSIPQQTIKVGDTPYSVLGADAEVIIYQPGESLAGDTAAEYWHSAPEVGASSTGNAGIELARTTNVADSPNTNSFDYSGDAVQAVGGTFPADWDGSIIVRIEQYLTYDVQATVDGPLIVGDFTQLAPFVGMQIEFIGNRPGTFFEIAYVGFDSSGAPVAIRLDGDSADVWEAGPLYAVIGYRGLQYRVTSATTSQITVNRLTDELEPDPSWPGFSTHSTANNDDSITVVGSAAQVGWAGPFTACPEGETTTKIEWDVFFSGGLARIRSDGDIDPTDQIVQVQYRPYGSGLPWTTISRTYTDATLDQIGFTERAIIPEMRPEVRMRITGGTDSAKFRRTAEWYGLRSQLTAPDSYPWTTVSVKLKDASRLAQISETKINMVPTRILPVLDGAGNWGDDQPTRSIASAIRHVAQSIGYTDDQLDQDELIRLNTLWNARGDYFDYVFTEGTVRSALSTIMRAGFASLTTTNGRITPVRDEPRTTFESGQGFSPQNMTDFLRKPFTLRGPSDFDGVDVEFFNRDTWTSDVVECRLPGDQGFKVEQLKLDGVTDRTRAWRIGMRRRQALKYRRWTYEFTTELEGLNATYMSYVPIVDITPNHGQSSLLRSVDGNELTVTEPMDWSDPGGHVVAWRLPDGTVDGPYPAQRGINDHVIIVNGPSPVIPERMEAPHVYFGPVDRWCYPALITDINPSAGMTVNITAMNYDDRVYQYDDDSPSV